MSMMCRPKWPFLLMCVSHDVRHVEFRGLTSSQRTPLEWGVTFSPCFFVMVFVMTVTKIGSYGHGHIGIRDKNYDTPNSRDHFFFFGY